MIEQVKSDFDKIVKTLDISKKEIDFKKNYLKKLKGMKFSHSVLSF